MSERPDELDPGSRADREHFGEASLGDAQSESDPDPYDERGADAYAAEREAGLTDPPAFEPVPEEDDLLEREEQLAREEAGAIGGVSGNEGIPEAERPMVEGGEGESEGFELAEQDLIEAASHGSSRGNPFGDRFPAEDARSEHLAEYGEADHERASERVDDDQR